MHLKATRIGQQAWRYQLISFHPSAGEPNGKARDGMLVRQGWFGGTDTYALVRQGKALHKNEARTSHRLMGEMNCLSYSYTTCIHVGEVDGWNNGQQSGDITICTPHYSTVCIYINEAADDDYPIGGGGGSSGGSPSGGPSSPAPAPIDTTMSDDFYEDERLRCIMKKLMQNNFYKNALNKFIGENKPINLNFRLSSTMQPYTLGETQPIPLQWNSKDIEIRLNANELPNHSSIQWALTLLHKGVHAEMFRALLSVKGPANLNNVNFPTLFKYYTEYAREYAQHAYMANHYVDVLGRALWEYDGKQFSLDHYKAMAWQGLEETAVYMNKPPAEKDAITAKKDAVLQGRNNTNCNDHGN